MKNKVIKQCAECGKWFDLNKSEGICFGPVDGETFCDSCAGVERDAQGQITYIGKYDYTPPKTQLRRMFDDITKMMHRYR